MKRFARLTYLSGRIGALTIARRAVECILLAAYALAASKGAPWWPLGLTVLLLVLVEAAFYSGIVRPYRRLERLVELFLEGYTLSGIGSTNGVNLTPASERLLTRIKEEFSAPSLLKLSKRQAQYRALQNQINPHFLYNTLESIRSESLIGGLDSVANMTEALAVFFRYTISKVENLVTVEEELQNCETYFLIQQYRFGERLQLRIECDEQDKSEIYRCRLPKLTLQPILENSIIHGTESKIGSGNLVVRLKRTGKRLLIEISDDGVGMDEMTLARLNERLGKSGRAFQDSEADKGDSIALVNVNNRIHLLFGEEYGLHIYSMPGAGTDVQIALPIITSDREVMNRDVLS